MKAGWAMRWAVALGPVLALGACGDDDAEPGVMCGPGTVAEDGLCVPAAGSNSGGSATGGSGTTGGTVNVGGTRNDGGAGSSNLGGVPPTDGGTGAGGDDVVAGGGA